jgi:hypothetical protein
VHDRIRGIHKRISETNLVCRELKQHVSGSLDAKKLPGNPYDVWIVSLLMLSALSLTGRGIAIGAEFGTNETLKRGGVIDVGGRVLLDRLKHMTFTTGNDGM